MLSLAGGANTTDFFLGTDHFYCKFLSRQFFENVDVSQSNFEYAYYK